MDGDSRGAQVAQLLAGHQQRISGYIRDLIPVRADAEEVLQEVNLFIWQHRDEFRPGSNFGAWAYEIARRRVLNFHKRKSAGTVRFSEVVMEQLAAGAKTDGDFAAARLDALERCLEKLSAKDQMLVRLRYEPDATTQSVAERSGRSLKAVYHALDRIRTTLLDCIGRTLAFQINACNRFAIGFYDADGRFHEVVAEDLPVEASRWYHLAAVSDGRTLRLYVDTDAGSVFSGLVTLNQDVILASAAVTGTNAVDFQADITGTANVKIAGTGTGGAGVFRFSSVKTYNGTTTVNANAMLDVTSAGGIPTKALTANGNAVFDNTQSVTVLNGASTGAVTVKSSTAILNVTGGGAFAGTVLDNGQFNVTGGALTTGATSGTGATSVSGSGTSLTADSIVQTTLTIGAGGSVTIRETTGEAGASPVPEPATWVLIGIGLLSLLAFRRR